MDKLKGKIEKALAVFWDDRIVVSVATPDNGNGADAPLDSLSSCEALLDIDDIVGFKVPAETVIRKGGYESREQFISELTSAVLKQVREQAS